MKEVVDRLVQYPNRYKLTNASTGAVLGTYDFTEEPGTVQQVGTEINAELFDSIAEDLALSTTKSPVQTGGIVTGKNTLANAVVPFKVESKNLLNLGATPKTNGAETSIVSNSVIVSATDNTSAFAFAAWKLNITSGKVTAQAFWTNTGAGAKGTAYLYWNENNIFTKVAGQINYSGRTVTIDVIPPSDGAELYLVLYARINSPTPTAGDYVTYTNVQVEIGDTSTPYSPYVADGTVAQVVACGKNLIPFPYYQGGAGTVVTTNGVTMTVNSDGTITCGGTATGDVRFYFTNLVLSGIPNIGLKGGQTYWLSRRCVVNYKTSPDGETLGVFGYDAGTTFVWQDNYILVNLRLQFGTGTETNYTISPIIAVTEGGEVPYEPYNGTEYSTQVGQTVEITQRDKFTTVYAETDGVAVSGEFVQTLRDEINTKPTIMTGTFANRPTATFDYHVLYVATDLQNDLRTTLLPAGKDGSVSGNWISILKEDKEHIVFESEAGVNIGVNDINIDAGGERVTIFTSDTDLTGKRLRVEIGSSTSANYFYEFTINVSFFASTTITIGTYLRVEGGINYYLDIYIANFALSSDGKTLLGKSFRRTLQTRPTDNTSFAKLDMYVYSVAIID